MPIIAIDALGGHNAPKAPVEAAARISRDTSIEVALVGDPVTIDRAIGGASYNPERLRIHPSGPDPDDSVAETCALVAAGKADAMVTAGAPPRALRACIDAFELLPGVRRAPLAAVYPTAAPKNRDPLALLLDVGANLDATAEDLVTWARMGVAYAARISGVEAPTVALLSTGTDPSAGPEAVVLAHRILERDARIRFVGNVEGLDIPRGRADVVVCNGYVGQVVVGLLGGLSDALLAAARGAYERKLAWKVGLKLLEDAVVRFHETISHERYAGAPLLGFDHIAILALPGSGPKTLANAIKLAAKAAREDIPTAVRRALEVAP